MKKLICAALLSATVFPASLHAAEMSIDRVILSTSGLANIVYSADVTGESHLEFPVRLNQVDDVLKSLVVFDTKGKVGGVTLPGRQPLDEIFKDLPFTPAQLSNPVALLNAYQGAAVTVTTGKEKFSGKLIRVTPEKTVIDDKEVIRNRISVMTDLGIRQALLEDAGTVQFDDPKIRAELDRALAAVRENGAQDRRLLTVSLPGGGDASRDVSLSYVVSAPVWKTAYRMVAPKAGETKGLLQGWAVVENMTAGDWKNVDLTLVSGNPVTFRQALYQSYYVDRPEIPVQVFGRIMPRLDGGTLASAEEAERDVRSQRVMQRGGGAMMKGMAAPAAAPMMAQENFAVAADMAMAESSMAGGSMGMDDVASVMNAAEGGEATTQVLFRFPQRVTLTSGQSMMLPFVSRNVPMERVFVYQPDTHPKHPLAAVEIKNDGETSLPPGVLTLYEESDLLKGAAFVGDAQMPALDKGGDRMISYALDTKTTINRTDKEDRTEGKITISQGVMKTAIRTRAETTYIIKAPAEEERAVVIEHPKRHDFHLITPDPKEAEVTDNYYRLRVTAKAGESKTFNVVLENEGWQSYSIEGMPTDMLLAYAATRGELDDATRKVFEKLAALRREMDVIDQRVMMLEQQRQSIFEDQERVRENLKSLTGKSDVRDKYLEKLDQQEDSIGKIDAEKRKLTEDRAQKQQDLQKLVAEISL